MGSSEEGTQFTCCRAIMRSSSVSPAAPPSMFEFSKCGSPRWRWAFSSDSVSYTVMYSLPLTLLSPPVLLSVGSMPIAGPVSATIIKMSIENRFESGKAVALGAGISEMLYAGIAFVGFGTMSAVIKSYELVTS